MLTDMLQCLTANNNNKRKLLPESLKEKKRWTPPVESVKLIQTQPPTADPQLHEVLIKPSGTNLFLFLLS